MNTTPTIASGSCVTTTSIPAECVFTDAPTPANSPRDQDLRLASYTVKDLLKVRMKDLDIKNRDLQHALGYDRPNVIAMMRVGSMRLPANKAVITAKLLKIDPKFLLGKVIAENDFELWAEISSVMSTGFITDNEMSLIQLVRREQDGFDLNLQAIPEFTRALTPAIKKQTDRAKALVKAALHRVDK